MAELVWKGKGRARAQRSTALHTDEIHHDLGGQGDPGPWRDRLVLGKAERVLSALLPELAGTVALVVVDPPFDTGGSFDFLATIPGSPAGTPRVAVPAYEDARGLDAWLGWFAETAALLAKLLAPGGSLYVHLDAHVAHYAKVVLDEIFGPRAFQREIIWRIGWVSGFKSRARAWIRNHDTLLFYAKGGRPRTFHKEYIPYPADYVRRDGAAPTGKGYPLEDVWNASDIDRLDSIQIMSFSGEKVGYPTQKNEALVSRIVRASSSPGDLVLDCCAGSGTLAVAACRLGRRWVACDASAVAIHVARKRLLARQRGEARPFVVQHEGNTGPTGGSSRSRQLGARARIDGRRCTLQLSSYALAPPPGVKVRRWSQWLDGWCVDWAHAGGALSAGSSLWRDRRGELDLATTHVYDRPGSYVALVRAYDVLGGWATRAVRVRVV